MYVEGKESRRLVRMGDFDLEAELRKTPGQRMEEEGNPWQLDEKGNLFLTFERGMPNYKESGQSADLYWIDAERITERQVPDWLAQISEKSWATHATLGGLCRAFELLLGYRGKVLTSK